MRRPANHRRPFFTREHRAAFAPDKWESNTESVNLERRLVSDRFLELHERLFPVIRSRRWDLHRHHNEGHIVSSWHLVPGFVSSIAGMWLPYGRAKKAFQELEIGPRWQNKDEEDVAFFNHAKLQVLLVRDSVVIGLMIAQRNNEWDRDYLKKKLGLSKGKGPGPEVTAIVSLLREVGAKEPSAILERNNHEDPGDYETLQVAKLTKGDLLDFMGRDERGNWLGLWVRHDPDNPEVGEEDILQTSIRVFESMYPTYDALAWYPGKPEPLSGSRG